MSDAPLVPGTRAPQEALKALLLVSAVVAVFFARAWTTDLQFAFRDTGRMHLPVKAWIAGELSRGHLPEWNPYAGLGAPVVANAIDAPLHPFNLLLVALPFQLGFKLWILLSFVLAGTGAWWWARLLGHRPAGAALAALAFTLSGYLVSSTDNVTYLTAIATLPWVLGAGHRYARDGGPLALLGVAAASLLAAAAGDPQSWAFSVGLLPVASLLLVEGPPAGVRLRRGLVAAAVAAVAAAPVLLPVALFIPASSRAEPFAEQELVRWNTHPLRFLELVLPHLLRGRLGTVYNEVYQLYAGNDFSPTPWVLSLYAGAATVALALVGAARDRRSRLLLCGAAVFAWMAMGPHAGFAQLARHLPVLGAFRYWEKMAAWTTLLLAMASAGGLERLLASPAAARRVALGAGLAAGALLAFRAGGAVAQDRLQALVRIGAEHEAAGTFLQNLLEGAATAGLVLGLLSLVCLLLARGRLPRLAPAALVILAATELAASNVRAYVLSVPEVVSPAAPLALWLGRQPGLQRVVTPFQLSKDRWPHLLPVESAWLWGARTVGTAWNVPQRIGNTDPYTAMIPLRFQHYRLRAGLLKQLPTVGIFGVGYAVIPKSPAMASQVGLAPPHEAVAADPDLPAFLVKVPHRPRAYLAEEPRSAGKQDGLEFILDGKNALSRVTVVESEVPGAAAGGTGTARVSRDEGELVELLVTADRPALLVLSDAFAPGWTAEVDGRPAEIVPANYMVRGVWIPAGAQRVLFRYRTPGLLAGLALAAALAAGLGLWALAARRRA